MNRLVLLLCALAPLSLHAAGRISDPLIPDSPAQRISTHAWEVQGFPDVGFVVGERAVLVIDTGLGPANGARVLSHARRLAPGRALYLVTTHFHPEHAAGDGAFPPETVIVRSRVQQAELEREGGKLLALFRSRPAFREFLPEGLVARTPSRLFDQELTLDLGGVHARIVLVGPAHTLGDQVVWVEEDRTLFTGDLAMKDDPPKRFAEGANARVWIAALERLAAFEPLHVVPDHGEPGGPDLIAAERAVLAAREAAP